MQESAYLSIGVTSSSGPGPCGVSVERDQGVLRGFIQNPGYELPRIPIPRTPVNKGRKKMSRGYNAPALGLMDSLLCYSVVRQPPPTSFPVVSP